MKIKKWLIFLFFISLCISLSGFLNAGALSGQTTSSSTKTQADIDDEIMAKDPSLLTPAELRRYKKIKEAQTIKRSGYEKRAAKKLANEQPKTFDEYEKMSAEKKNSELQEFNPTFKKDPKLVHVPDVEVQVVRYNYPGGSRELNLSILKSQRHINSQGVLSPDGKFVAYTDVDYEPGMRKTSSNLYIIPVATPAAKSQKRAEFLKAKEERLKLLNEQLTKSQLSIGEKKAKRDEISKLKKEIEEIRKANIAQDKADIDAAQNDTPAQTRAKALIQTHIKDRISKPLMSTGLFDTDYGVQRTLTVIDWSEDSSKIVLKEKILKEGDGLWQTNLWVYDLETKKAKKLDEIRQAVEYYWNKNQIVDLYYYRFDIYPLGWDAQRKNVILIYAYGYNKNTGSTPKFLGTWGIDVNGEHSHLISVQKTGYVIQANGFCLRTKQLEYYER